MKTIFLYDALILYTVAVYSIRFITVPAIRKKSYSSEKLIPLSDNNIGKKHKEVKKNIDMEGVSYNHSFTILNCHTFMMQKFFVDKNIMEIKIK